VIAVKDRMGEIAAGTGQGEMGRRGDGARGKALFYAKGQFVRTCKKSARGPASPQL